MGKMLTLNSFNLNRGNYYDIFNINFYKIY
jgi:hypothetical protein